MKFAVISAWPDVKNAEYEIIERIKISAAATGNECIVVDNTGAILGKNGKPSKTILSADQVEFCLALHFISPKIFKVYTYGALWNPPSYIKDWDYDRFIQHYLSYDDFLDYGSQPITNHAANLIYGFGRTLPDDDFKFVASVSKADTIPPARLDDFRVFYIGMNWEKIANTKGRHYELFKQLDELGKMAFYGPREFQGVKPWSDYKCYKGEPAFDGSAVIKAINDCGVALVISSDVHYRNHAATNRLYEACAAGVVIIAEDNPFIVREFGDSLLYFEHDPADSSKSFHQIVAHIKWIQANKEAALELAKRSQAIFLERFTMEQQISKLCFRHEERKVAVRRQRESDQGHISVLVICLGMFPLDEILADLRQQRHPNLHIRILMDENDTASAEAFAAADLDGMDVSLMKAPLFSTRQVDRGNRTTTVGDLIHANKDHFTSDYAAVLYRSVSLAPDHFSSLVKSIERSKAKLGYSGFVIANRIDSRANMGSYHFNFFRTIGVDEVDRCEVPVPIDFMLMTKDFVENLNWYAVQGMDGFESALMINLAGLTNTAFSAALTAAHVFPDGEEIKLPYRQSAEWQKQLVKDAVLHRRNEMPLVYHSQVKTSMDINELHNVMVPYLYAQFGGDTKLFRAIRGMYRILIKPFRKL